MDEENFRQGIKKGLFPQRPFIELEPLPRGFVRQIPSKERFAYCNTPVTGCKGFFAQMHGVSSVSSDQV